LSGQSNLLCGGDFKIIEKTIDASEHMVVDAPQAAVNVCCQSKYGFCGVQVINCTAQVSKKSKKLDIIVNAVRKVFGTQGFYI
jgi:hypothetical protein